MSYHDSLHPIRAGLAEPFKHVTHAAMGASEAGQTATYRVSARTKNYSYGLFFNEAGEPYRLIVHVMTTWGFSRDERCNPRVFNLPDAHPDIAALVIKMLAAAVRIPCAAQPRKLETVTIVPANPS